MAVGNRIKCSGVECFNPIVRYVPDSFIYGQLLAFTRVNGQILV
jgi:hypothetical protein